MADAAHASAPHVIWICPFVALLLSIAVLPLVPWARHWWERNRNKLLVSLTLSAATLAYYGLRGAGIGQAGAAHGAAAPGLETVRTVLSHAIIGEYFPFMVLLFSLYVIAGGIVVRGDVRATPAANTAILATGGILASFIGTTGAAMVLIRFLLATNSERERKAHTVVFFVFVVANMGGLLLPLGDPPLFLGYLLGVEFLWTLRLWAEWAFVLTALLGIYFVWDTLEHAKERPEALRLDESRVTPVHAAGLANFLWLGGVVLAVATLDPSKAFPGTAWHAPSYLREVVQLAMAALSLWTTPRTLRQENRFTFSAIAEVAALFVGIFVTMQVPLEILRSSGPRLGLSEPWHFFWASGALSSFLDNAPTYMVFFAAAGTLSPAGADLVSGVQTATGSIPSALLAAVSCGSVFMGANTYIGNGPNFMVKAIAEESGVKMPSFFGYMAYSGAILIPLFGLVTLVFFGP
jgi:Na+/H+ antiporter NhaD/arsenite permease-like protein